MNRFCVLIAALFVLALPSTAVADSISGNQYLDLSVKQKGWYFLGVLDAMKQTRDVYMVQGEMDAANFDKLWKACISGRPVRQHIAIFDTWLNSNPTRWHEQAIVLIFESTKQSCAEFDNSE